jgi:hypothetical protein
MTREHKGLSNRTAELLHMLTYKRPSGSKSETAFIKRYVTPLGALPDEYGNHWLTVGKDSPILWSSHTDTVHKDGGSQQVIYGDGIVTLGSKTNCLGADCTVGVWIMANMIRANIPGTYVFHADEEIGGLGSSYIAKECQERLQNIQFAIAFDRKGNDEIITHQMGERMTSASFGKSLADVLRPLNYRLSDGGSFTDTANYGYIIPECTNISVGYKHQHTASEQLDVYHAERLLDHILMAQWDNLVCERNPTDVGHWWDDKHYSVDALAKFQTGFAEYVRHNPQAVADFLEANGFSEAEIETYIWGEAPDDYRGFFGR